MSTNEELKKLMADIPLTQANVASITESSVETVKGWCSGVNTTRYRNMPQGKLKLLKLELAVNGNKLSH
jgi:hypothetical protein